MSSRRGIRRTDNGAHAYQGTNGGRAARLTAKLRQRGARPVALPTLNLLLATTPPTSATMLPPRRAHVGKQVRRSILVAVQA
jgi:hypothetical protein